MTVAQGSHERAGWALPWRHLALAAGYGVAVLAVWWLAYGSERGLRFDVEAAFGLDTSGYDVDFFLFSVRIVVPLTIVVTAAVALLGRRRHALGAAVVLVGASGSCVVLKTVLGRLDPLHGDAARGIGEFFPSVHTGAAAGAAFALTLLAGNRLRLPAAFAASFYVAAVAMASVVAGGHFPSDVVGALFVAAAWGSLGAGLIALAGPVAEPSARSSDGVLALLLAGVAAATAVVVIAFAVEDGWASEHPSSLATLAGIAFVVPAIAAAFVSELGAAENGR